MITILFRVLDKTRVLGILCDVSGLIKYIPKEEVHRYKYSNAKITARGDILTNKREAPRVFSIDRRHLDRILTKPQITLDELYNNLANISDELAWRCKHDRYWVTHSSTLDKCVTHERLDTELFDMVMVNINSRSYLQLKAAIKQLEKNRKDLIEELYKK